MTDDPFLLLVCDALGLMHRPFTDPADPRTLAAEFYHQFRKLWDRGIPVGMGLGHLIPRAGRAPDLTVIRMGERGAADERLAAVWFDLPPGPVDGFTHTIAVVVGDVVVPDGVTAVRFDHRRWAASVVG